MTAVTRACGSVITGPEEFSLLWPSLFDRVVATLRQRGVDWASAEDAVQEAGARALANQVPYTSEHDLRRWVQTVAWRVAVDNHRRTTRWRAPWAAGGRGADGGGLSAMGGAEAEPERITTSVDVAHEVEARFELKAVERMFPLLSAADRAALLDTAPAGQTRKEAVRLAVRRHRARARLVAMVEGLASAIGFLPWRRLGAWRAAIIPSVAAATLVPLALIAPPLVGQGGSDDRGRGTEVNRGVVVQTTSHGTSPAASQPSEGGDHTGTASGHDDAGARGRAGRPASTPAPDHAGTNGSLSFRAGIPGPPGEPDQGETGVRPKEEGKPLFCVTAPTTGRVCTPDRKVEDALSANGL